jgi:hypothetical protein
MKPMVPDAYERAANIVEQQHVLGLMRSIQISIWAAYRDGHAAGFAESLEMAARYHDDRGNLVARSSAYQKAWHEMAAKDIRALATAPTVEK